MLRRRTIRKLSLPDGSDAEEPLLVGLRDRALMSSSGVAPTMDEHRSLAFSWPRGWMATQAAGHTGAGG